MGKIKTQEVEQWIYSYILSQYTTVSGQKLEIKLLFLRRMAQKKKKKEKKNPKQKSQDAREWWILSVTKTYRGVRDNFPLLEWRQISVSSREQWRERVRERERGKKSVVQCKGLSDWQVSVSGLKARLCRCGPNPEHGTGRKRRKTHDWFFFAIKSRGATTLSSAIIINPCREYKVQHRPQSVTAHCQQRCNGKKKKNEEA